MLSVSRRLPGPSCNGLEEEQVFYHHDASAQLSNEDLWVFKAEKLSQFLGRLAVETAIFHVISYSIYWASRPSQAICD